jgi:RNA polymerase sigma-70 factor (ECF subfamily)
MRIADDAELAVCRCLYRVLPSLPADYARLIWQVDLLGQPRNKVARDLGISANALGVRIHRARRALRDALLRLCTTCPTHGFLNCACEEERPMEAEK